MIIAIAYLMMQASAPLPVGDDSSRNDCPSMRVPVSESMALVLDQLECWVINSDSETKASERRFAIELVRRVQKDGDENQQVNASYTGAKLGDIDSLDILEIWANSGNAEAAYRAARGIHIIGRCKAHGQNIAVPTASYLCRFSWGGWAIVLVSEELCQ